MAKNATIETKIKRAEYGKCSICSDELSGTFGAWFRHTRSTHPTIEMKGDLFWVSNERVFYHGRDYKKGSLVNLNPDGKFHKSAGFAKKPMELKMGKLK